MIPGGPRAWYIDLPTYAEVIAQFPGFGFPGLDIAQAKYPNLFSRKDELETRFYARYCQRMIGFETLQLWQIKLQNRFDDIADEYERAFRIYSANATQMDRAVEGWTEQESSSASGSADTTSQGSTSSDSNGKEIDTPDSAINDSDSYADRQTKNHRYDSENSSDHTYTNASGSKTKSHEIGGGRAVTSVNENIDAYRDYESRFLAEFEALFNGVLC